MVHENINPANNSSSHVYMEIMALEQQMRQGGNIDSENDEFKSIYERLNTKQITPEEALKEITILSNSRQNYH